MKKSLTDEEFARFFESHSGWVVLSTIDESGFPHSIPIGYFCYDGKVYCGTRDNTKKIRNIEKNSKVSLLIESGSTMDDIKGAMIQGEASICRSEPDVLRLSQIAARARGVADEHIPTMARPGAAYIEVTAVKRVSWDYGNVR